MQADVAVLGGGPGGYTAAFRAADLGRKVVLIERFPVLGGVCLNVGCIPSKALLHVAGAMTEAAGLRRWGIEFASPRVNLDRLRARKNEVVDKLANGLAQLARQRNVTVVRGVGRFSSPSAIRVDSEDGARNVSFDQAIVAAGARPARLAGLPDDPRIMDSTSALELRDIPKRLLVIGGGVIGLELAGVYAELGSAVTVVEWSDALLPGVDPDIVRPLERRVLERYEGVHVKTRVSRIDATSQGLVVQFEGPEALSPQLFDRVLVAVGRKPNGRLIGLEYAGVAVSDEGHIPVDRQQRTNVPHIFAIGDVVGEPMLAHKAAHQGKVAAEVSAGLAASFESVAIPRVAYTNPEVAWVGLSEPEARTKGIEVDKGLFPWGASGRSLAMGRDDGLTKLLFHKGTRRIVGAGIVGQNAGELIAEAVLAMELGAEAADLSLTIHPHPTLAETVGLAAEVAEGTITDLPVARR
jgi:dihydrolipoamide dehydrogenase